MASKAAVRLKEDWMKMPVEWFEPTTFGELKMGERFIALPCPGDNDGHGGFRGVHGIFVKMFVESGARRNARKLSDGKTHKMPDSMLVIRVD